MLKAPVWVVLADAGGARFFQRARANAKLAERVDLAMTAAPLEAPRGRLGRVHDRMGPARHAMAPRQSLRAASAALFLKTVAGVVNAAADAGTFKSLVLCAPPRPLGLLRENLSAPARERLSQVLAKDYLHASAEELEQRLHAE